MRGTGERQAFGTNSKQRDADDFYAELRDADVNDEAHARALRALALSGKILLIVKQQYAEEAEQGAPRTSLKIIKNNEEVA